MTVRMSPREFDQLADGWAPAGSLLARDPAGRFRDEGNDLVTPATSWEHVYSFGENYASVLLAKAFLDAVGAPFEVVRDALSIEGDPEGSWSSWRIFTDYNQ
jgi:hypothetical protein